MIVDLEEYSLRQSLRILLMCLNYANDADIFSPNSEIRRRKMKPTAFAQLTLFKK